MSDRSLTMGKGEETDFEIAESVANYVDVFEIGGQILAAHSGYLNDERRSYEHIPENVCFLIHKPSFCDSKKFTLHILVPLCILTNLSPGALCLIDLGLAHNTKVYSKYLYASIISLMWNMKFNPAENDSTEEKFLWLLRFATVKQIRDFLTKNPPIDLHYPTRNLETPLTATIDRGDSQILSFLLERNSTNLDDTVTQPYRRTALMYASFVSRHSEILQILLKKGSDLHKMDMRGWTCLQYAIVGERLKNVTFLLDSGAFADHRDFQGRTPLMTSVYLSNLDILSILLGHTAEIDSRDNFGFTALQLAILSRKRDATIVLIEGGCDLGVVTPLTKASIGELCRTSMPNVLRCIEPKGRIL